MNTGEAEGLKRWPTLFEIPAPDPERLLRRIKFNERNLLLPVKAVFIGMIWYSFFNRHQPWLGLPGGTLDVVVELVQYIFIFYAVASAVLAMFVVGMDHLPLAVVQWSVVTSSMVDGLFIAVLALITNGMASPMFWLFVVLIVRNAVSVPPGFSQLILNIFISLCYVLVAVLDVTVISNLAGHGAADL